jgi:hypothetical protein
MTIVHRPVPAGLPFVPGGSSDGDRAGPGHGCWFGPFGTVLSSLGRLWARALDPRADKGSGEARLAIIPASAASMPWRNRQRLGIAWAPFWLGVALGRDCLAWSGCNRLT